MLLSSPGTFNAHKFNAFQFMFMAQWGWSAAVELFILWFYEFEEVEISGKAKRVSFQMSIKYSTIQLE